MTYARPEEDLGNAVADALDAGAQALGRILGHVDRLVDDVTRDATVLARDSQLFYRAMAKQAQSVSDAARSSPRFARIVSTGLRIIAGYRIHEGRVAVAGNARTATALERLHHRSAKRIFDLCVDLRGGALKVGQFISSRVDILPQAYIDTLAALQDRVPPVPTEQIVERIEAELGAPIDELFATFNPEPIAAASLAQVHAATRKHGTPVAVKVLVPGIEEEVETDLAAFRVVAAALAEVFPMIDLVTIANELSRSVRLELDLRTEAESALAFAEQFADWDHVVVPAIHRDLSSRGVLTMELLEGERLFDYLDSCENRGEEGQADIDRLFDTMLRAFCAQVIDHGLFHADPHPGNFLVLPGNRLAILDFGSVQEFPPATRRAYAELATAILARDAQRMSELLARLGFATRDGDDQTLLSFAEMIMQVFRPEMAQANLSEIDPRAELERAMRLVKENPVTRIPQDFVLLGRVFGALGGLLLRYKPRINLFATLSPYLARAMAAAA